MEICVSGGLYCSWFWICCYFAVDYVGSHCFVLEASVAPYDDVVVVAAAPGDDDVAVVVIYVDLVLVDLVLVIVIHPTDNVVFAGHNT